MGGFGVLQLKIVPTHKELSGALVYEAHVHPDATWYMTFVSSSPPVKDTRMRQVMSMMIDCEPMRRDRHRDRLTPSWMDITN
jgi:hypothetical protein